MWDSFFRGILSRKFFLSFALLLNLAACGGGGGGDNTDSNTSPDPYASEYTINVSVTGLSGDGLVLGLTRYSPSGQEQLTIPANGEYSFAAKLQYQESFYVYFVSYPQNPELRCFFDNDNGTISGSNIDISVQCFPGFAISGNVTGLAAGSLELYLSSISTSELLSIDSNGSFRFQKPLLNNEEYDIIIFTQPDNPLQLCSITNNSGTVNAQHINNIGINCELAHTLGGPITGLRGYGLVIQNNASDDLHINPYTFLTDYTFDTPVTENNLYDISILTQPSSPSQTCTISNGSGQVGTDDITNAAIDCVTDSFTFGGTVSGLNGTGLTLSSIWAGNLVIDSNGSFTFPAQPDNTSFHIDIGSQPTNPDQICTVSNGDSYLNGADYIDIQVNCINTYSISGTVSGLGSSGNLQLYNNSSDSIIMYADGPFTFNRKLINGSDYLVTFNYAPPSKLCTVNNDSGTLSGTNITNVEVICSTRTYTIGGTVSGMSGSGLVLQNNAGDDLIINGNGSFTFSTPVEFGNSYDVSLLTPPSSPDQYCTLRKNQGDNVTANINNIIVECSSETALEASALSASVTLDWPQITNTNYDLYYSTDPDFNVENYASYANGTLLSSVTSPLQVTGLTNDTAYYFILRPTPASPSAPALPDSEKIASRPGTIGFDDTIYDSSVDVDGTIYLGGKFRHAGAIIGNGIPVSMTSNNLARGEFPLVNGEILTTISDGSGGWFIGGDFTHLNNLPRSRLAHILADGTVDTAWVPAANDTVRTLALMNNIIYIGGDFTEIDGQSRSLLAAVHIDGNLQNWSPTVDSGTTVFTIAPANDILYIGGNFSSVNNTTRNHLAAMDTAGNLTNWAPVANNSVSKIVVDGNDLFIAGNFTNISNNNRANIAQIGSDGTVGNFRPNIYGRIRDMAIRGNTIYAVGLIVTNDGPKHLTAIDKDGTVNNYLPTPNTDTRAIAISGTTLYVAGIFTSVDDEPRYSIAAINIDGTLNNWAPKIHRGLVNTLSISGDALYAGGQFSIFNGAERSGLASINAGQLDDWSPGIDYGWVNTLDHNASGIYFGGYFNSVNGVSRSNLAAVSINGDLLSWDPAANSEVHTLSIANNTVYIGGSFTQIATEPRSQLAAVGTDGSLSSWNPGVTTGYYSQGVSDILVANDTVYIAGNFNNVGGYTRNYLAAIGTDGAVGSWNPGPNAPVTALAIDGSNLYIGGAFTRVSNIPRNHLASINIDGTINEWNPDVAETSTTATPSIYSLAVDNGLVYVAGHYDRIGPAVRTNLCAISSDGLVTPWDAAVEDNATIYTLDISGGLIHAGGDTQTANGIVRSKFASFNSSGQVQ